MSLTSIGTIYMTSGNEDTEMSEYNIERSTGFVEQMEMEGVWRGAL